MTCMSLEKGTASNILIIWNQGQRFGLRRVVWLGPDELYRRRGFSVPGMYPWDLHELEWCVLGPSPLRAGGFACGFLVLAYRDRVSCDGRENVMVRNKRERSRGCNEREKGEQMGRCNGVQGK
jgi:hypothetical protein